MDAVSAAQWLRDRTAALDPGPPVALTYHPLTYAWAAHEAYLRRYAAGPKKALLVGMNPGPWGMGQTGIPFGDVQLVGDWLGLRGASVQAPANMHPKRPVDGWGTRRREQSGLRLWGELQRLWSTPDRALRDLLIVNHCPLLMFNDALQNVTPDKLRKDDQERVLATCDEGLWHMVEALSPCTLIGVGKYAEGRCRIVTEQHRSDIEVLGILHPSPASPLANKDNGRHWQASVHAAFSRADLL